MSTTAATIDADDLWDGYEEDYDEQDFMDIGPAPQPLAWFMSFSDAQQAWGPGKYPRGKYGDYLFTVKKIWDNYSNPAGMGPTESIIYKLSLVFPDVKATQVKRPLGDFKDLLTLSYEEIYDALCDRLDARHRNKDGKWQSFMEVSYDHADYLIREYMAKSKLLSRSQFYDAMSMMLYKSAEGIFLEGEVSRLLAKQIEASALSKRFRYEEAPASMEGQDVDGVIIDKKTEKIAVYISIKTDGALTEKTMRHYRKPKDQGGKGKTKPDIYIGFTGKADWIADRLTYLKPHGKGLKQLLRDYLEA